MKIKLLTLFICLTTFVHAQHTLKGRIENYPSRELNICTQFGEHSRIEDNLITTSTGEFNFTFDNQKFGLYRIYFDNDEYFDIIFYKEDIELTTRLDNPQYSMTILKSEENKQFYNYIIGDMEANYKINVLREFAEIYPQGDFTKKVGDEIYKEIQNKNKNIDKVIKENPQSFTSRYIKFYKEIIPSAKYNDAQKLDYVKTNFWKNYKMTDVELIHSNAYNHVVINYLKLTRNPNPKNYYEAAKNIMDNVFFEDPKISAFVLEYILTGFEMMGLHEAMADLSYEYGNLCKDDDEDNNLKLRLKNNTELAIGKKAPDFSFMTVTGENYKLSEMKTDYTLIVFWATWCGHCTTMLPELAKYKNNFDQRNIDVVTISLDTDKEGLIEFIAENNIPYKVICDIQGWNSGVVVDYAVYGTPTMYLIDKNLNIIAKPYNEDKLFTDIERLLNR